MSMSIEPPECPVCLEPYDSSITIPRVLPCGHSACEDCLSLLPNPFLNTIRCPACTQLVKLTLPSSLPKNIDLLRFSALLPPQPPPLINHHKHINVHNPFHQFVQNMSTQHFLLNWKDWVVPQDRVLFDLNRNDAYFTTLDGKCGSDEVSLVRIGCFGLCHDGMKLSFSYVSKVMWVLYKMKDEERDELRLVLNVSRSRGLCKVYGFWYNDDDRSLYMVSKRHVKRFCESWRNVVFGEGSGEECFSLSTFPMIGMEICEAIICLHSEGLYLGCLTMRCFCFDEFGHVYIDLNECLVSSRRIGSLIKKVIEYRENGKESEFIFENDDAEIIAFLSPDIFLELLKKERVDFRCEIKSETGLASDVWSLGCVLLTLFYGEPFIKLITIEGADYIGFYQGLRDKMRSLLEGTVVSWDRSLQFILCSCLFFDTCDRPAVTEVWKCVRELFIKPQFDTVTGLAQVDETGEKEKHCLFWVELCKLGGEPNKSSVKKLANGLETKVEDGDVQVEGKSRDLIEGLSENHIRCIELKGHLDCVTGLAVGGGFLYSSSYDKTVQVWSLQDFSHVHTFKSHEDKVTALVFMDKEKPLCISADGGGGIFIWDVSSPLGHEPIKKLYEQKDWRYTGIHCLAVSGTEYLYTGSGDKSIKAWSLQDYTLSFVMHGHNSVVSTLVVSDGVLYSGSWDGTVRLWCLSDHSPLAVLGEPGPGNVTSVLCVAAYGHVLAVAHEDGTIKIWRDNALLKCVQAHKGAIFSVGVGGKWLFTGGWDKAVNVQIPCVNELRLHLHDSENLPFFILKELLADDIQADSIPVGSIACNAVITSLFYWQGKLFVGQADRVIEVYCYGS